MPSMVFVNWTVCYTYVRPWTIAVLLAYAVLFQTSAHPCAKADP